MPPKINPAVEACEQEVTRVVGQFLDAQGVHAEHRRNLESDLLSTLKGFHESLVTVFGSEAASYIAHELVTVLRAPVETVTPERIAQALRGSAEDASPGQISMDFHLRKNYVARVRRGVAALINLRRQPR